MKRLSDSSSAGFGILPAMLLLVLLSAAILYFEGLINNSQKHLKSLVASVDMDSLANEVTLVLRNIQNCTKILTLDGPLNPKVQNRNGPEVTIQYPGGLVIAQKGMKGLTTLSLQHAYLVPVRDARKSPKENNYLVELRLIATKTDSAFGGTLQRIIPIYIQYNGGIQACFATTYINANQQITYEDNICRRASSGSQVATASATASPSTTSYFDPWPDPTDPNASFCLKRP